MPEPGTPLNMSEWADCKEYEEFPDPKKLVIALDRPLKTPQGPEEQFVALWYRHGHPVMGRAWPKQGRLCASFTDGDREFTGRSVGQLQILVRSASCQSVFVYCWKPFGTVAKYDNKEFHPVHISFVTPCVLVTREGYEVLGGANLKEECAQSTINGRIIKFVGKDIENFNILCRKICQDTIEI